MPTQNSWNNKISTGPAITLNSGTNAINISSDASATTVNLATGGAVKTVSLGSTNGASVTTVDCGTGGANFGATANAHTTIVGSTSGASASTFQSGSGALAVTSANGTLTINSGTGALGISTDASATTLSIGTGGAVKGLTLGSTNSTSASTLQSGSGALNVTATGGALTINSGTGTLSISSDASAATVNIATGGAAKVVTLGSTNGASSLALKTGTADFTLASATGTVMSALDTGECTYPLQSAFLAYLASDDNNVTGAGTIYTLGTNVALTEVFDQGGDFNTNGTFTAPVTGRYNLGFFCNMFGCTIASTFQARIVTSNRTYFVFYARAASANAQNIAEFTLADMDAADTCTYRVYAAGEAADTVEVDGDASCVTYVYGNLVC